MSKRVLPLQVEDSKKASIYRLSDTQIAKPLDKAPLAWKVAPASALTEEPSPYKRKEEFVQIIHTIAEKAGTPLGLAVLAGTIVGVTNWSKISIAQQHKAITKGAGVFEASAMTYFLLSGPDAENVLNMLTPRDVSNLKPGHALFALFTTPEGSVDDEAVVLRLSKDEFLLSCGGCKPVSNPLSHLNQAIDKFPHVSLTFPSIVSFNIKGPKREEAISQLIQASERDVLKKLAVFQFGSFTFLNGQKVWILRTKIGMEMWAKSDVIKEAWAQMLNQPAVFTPCGWDILHAYRMDCQDIPFYLFPLDIHSGTNLWEIGCGWMVKNKTCDYIGKKTLTRSRPLRRFTLKKIVAALPSHDTAKAGTRLLSEKGDFAGYVTSSAFSLKNQRPYAFAHLFNSDYKGPLLVEGTSDQWLIQ